MTLNDLCLVAAERFPGLDAEQLRGAANGLQFDTGAGKVLFERNAVKRAESLDELREYVASREVQ